MSLVTAGIGAAGSLLGGAAAGGLFSGSPSTQSVSDISSGAAENKRRLLYGFQGTPGLDVSTPFSALNAGTGAVNIDPLARNLGLGAYNTFSGSVGDTRSALLGNQNAFERARVNPLLEQIMKGRGGLER